MTFVLIALAAIVGITALAYLGAWYWFRATHVPNIDATYRFSKRGWNRFFWLPAITPSILTNMGLRPVVTITVGWLCFVVDFHLVPRSLMSSIIESMESSQKTIGEVKKTIAKAKPATKTSKPTPKVAKSVAKTTKTVTSKPTAKKK